VGADKLKRTDPGSSVVAEQLCVSHAWTGNVRRQLFEKYKKEQISYCCTSGRLRQIPDIDKN
jgi:hypothetical protein